MPAQGMVVIVTRGKVNVSSDGQHADDDEHEDDIYEMEVTLESSDIVMYAFRDFEDVISAAKQLKASSLSDDGRLYSYKGRWILAFDTAAAEAPSQNADCCAGRVW